VDIGHGNVIDVEEARARTRSSDLGKMHAIK
jgi:hypothetical protein